ncbi:MAG TPA: DUF3501 family protein [Mizugakiibacter sp.]|nr:DUF3501 family protein [Mizugakiibacter sp.]
MQKLTHTDLLSLEIYSRERSDFRTRVVAHKRERTVHLGPHLTFLFEDRLTVQYQIQEMLRIERIFEPDAIAAELLTYNSLIPDGTNLKATLMIEYADVEERRRALLAMRGIEHGFTLQVAGCSVSVATADEDLDRSNEEKTSAVHFLRFELAPASITAWHQDAEVSLAVAHPAYTYRCILNSGQQKVLAADFD